MYAHVMLILINRCLLNVVFSITKALNGQISPKQIFVIPIFQCYLENTASLNACFPLFHTPFFISSLIKFQVTRLQLGLRGLCSNQISWIPN